MAKAVVWQQRIDIFGRLPDGQCETLLNELKVEHIPSLTPTGRRLFVVMRPEGLATTIYRTHTMPDAEVLWILKKFGIAARIGSEKPRPSSVEDDLADRPSMRAILEEQERRER